MISEQIEGTPLAGKSVRYTLEQFTDDIQSEVAPAGIALRLEEAADKTRTVHAWRTTTSEAVSIFPIDEVRITRYEAHLIALAIRRTVRPA